MAIAISKLMKPEKHDNDSFYAYQFHSYCNSFKLKKKAHSSSGSTFLTIESLEVLEYNMKRTE